LATEKSAKPRGKNKWVKEILFILGMLVLSAGIAFLLYRFQNIYDVSLRSYGWLAYILVFILSLLSSATIFVPAPGLAFTLAAATVWNPLLVAIAAGTGDAIGELTSYWVGYIGERMIVDEHMPAYQKAVAWMNGYGVWAIFAVALVPVLLFDLVGMAAGALKIRWWRFLIAAWCGKLLRILLVTCLWQQAAVFIGGWFH